MGKNLVGQDEWTRRGEGVPRSVRNADLADLAVTLAKMAANSVDSSKIIDGSIMAADINAAAAILETQLAAALQTKIDGAVQGLIAARMQWASSVATPNGSGDVTTTFPVAFPSAPSCIIVTNGERAQGPFYCGTFNSATTTQFTARFEQSPGVPQVAISRYNWIAII